MDVGVFEFDDFDDPSQVFQSSGMLPALQEEDEVPPTMAETGGGVGMMPATLDDAPVFHEEELNVALSTSATPTALTDLTNFQDQPQGTKKTETTTEVDSNQLSSALGGNSAGSIRLLPRSKQLFKSQVAAAASTQLGQEAKALQNKQQQQQQQAPQTDEDPADNENLLAANLRESVRTNVVGDAMTYLLTTCFGHSDFRPGQAEAILLILRGESVLVELPTATGKSLVYQFAILMYRVAFGGRKTKGKQTKYGIVISPLLSLIQDQLTDIKAKGVPLTCFSLGGNTARDKERGILARMVGAAAGQSHVTTDTATATATTAAPTADVGSADEDELDLVFLSPERLVSNQLLREALCKSMHSIAFVCIDEAHCVSEWSHDFRPSYMNIRHCINQLHQEAVNDKKGSDTPSAFQAPPPFLALTATASTEVRNEMIRSLGGMTALKGPRMHHIQHDLPRSNLELACLDLTQARKSQTKAAPAAGAKPATTSNATTIAGSDSSNFGHQIDSLIDLVHSVQQPTIVYVSTQTEAELVADELRRVQLKSKPKDSSRGKRNRGGKGGHEKDEKDDGHEELKSLSVRSYHGGMMLGERMRVQRHFVQNTGEVNVLVATVAFGMGINKADIRSVIHFHVPASLEEYVQEVGRAGRDGKPAKCVTLYDPYRYFTLRSRMSSGVLGKEQLEMVVRSMFSPHTTLESDVTFGINYIHSESIGAQVGIEQSVIDTVLFQAAHLYPDLFRVEGTLPLRATISDFKPEGQKSGEGRGRQGRKRTFDSSGVTTSMVYQQLNLQDKVLEYIKDAHTRTRMDLVAMAQVLAVPMVTLVDRLKELSNDDGTMRVNFEQYGYAVRLLKPKDLMVSSQGTNDNQRLTQLVAELHGVRLAQHTRGLARLSATFAALQNPDHEVIGTLLRDGNHDNANGGSSDNLANGDATGEVTLSDKLSFVSQWKEPEPGISKMRAVELVADFYRSHGARIESPLQAAKVLIGALAGGGGPDAASGPGGGRGKHLIADQWREKRDYYGKLNEHALLWVEKLCVAQTKECVRPGPSDDRVTLE